MEIKPDIDHERGKDSFQVEVRSGGKLVGFASFFKTIVNGMSAWAARVDVKKKHRGKSIATEALKAGDTHIKSVDPNALRVFEDLNQFSYRGYLNEINDENIVDITSDGKIIFKP